RAADSFPTRRSSDLVVEAAPRSRIILDVNEGWNDDNISENLAAAAELGVALVEQPLPAGRDGILTEIAHPVPICADESLHEVHEDRKSTRLNSRHVE